MILHSLTGGKTLLGLVAAGWLATVLASTNGDVDAGIAAYEAGDHDAALAAYAAAEEALGERSEIHYNRGLALLAKDDREAARKAFEHGSESEDERVRASAEYELGNLDFDAEAWEGAIEHYIACLKVNPEHQAAKWNLELARLRKKQQEEEQEKDEDEKDEDEKDEDEKSEDEKSEDEKSEDEKDEDEKSEDEKDEDEQDEDEQNEDEQDEKSEDEKSEDEKSEDEKNQEEQSQDEQDKGEDEQEQQQQPQQQPVERADLDKALEELDAQDDFFLGRPLGRTAPVEKDW